MNNDIKPWRYRHFKWNEYEVIFIASNSENPNEKLVIYKALYWDNEIWARPKEMFEATIEKNWKTIKRFEYIW